MIGILDYGAGNLRSIIKAFFFLRLPVRVVSSLKEAKGLDRLVIPGVGSFGSAINQIKKRELYHFLIEWIYENKSTLGICLGLQLLFERSEESPDAVGLSLFPGTSHKIIAKKVPHIGWNQVKVIREDPIFDEIEENEFFYFAHSYAVFQLEVLNDKVLGVTDYGRTFCSILRSGKVYGVQFHPEKSGKTGIRFLQNWGTKC